MNKPKTIDEALTLVPEYIMLRPGVDVLMRGDRFPGGLADEGKMVWHEIMPETIGLTVPHGFQIWARPIPEPVRRAMAWWAMYNAHADRSARDYGWLFYIRPEIDSSEGGIVVACDGFIQTDDNHGIRKFSSKERLREFLALAPEVDVISMMDDHNPFESWLLRGGVCPT